MALAYPANHVYYLSTVKTMAVGFGDLCKKGGRTAPRMFGGFFASAQSLSAPPWAGYGGEGFGPAGLLFCQFANPVVCPPAPFGDGRWVKLPKKGGHDMATIAISARSEQTHSSYPLAARAARKAARQWFSGIPTQSLAVWRDTCRQDHCHGLPNFDARGTAFDDAFAREIGNLIIGGGRAGV